MNEQLKILGNVIGDILTNLEQEAIGTSEDQYYIDQIRSLFDSYAGEFDEVLNKHNSTIVRELKRLMLCLLIDLKKVDIQKSQVGFLIKKTNII